MAGLRHPSKFQQVSHLGFVTAPTSLNGAQPNFARCFAISSVATLYIFGRLFPPKGILPGAKFTLRPTLVLFCIGSITARHSSSGRQANFMVLSRGHHLYLAGRPSRWPSAHILVNICGFDEQYWKSKNIAVTDRIISKLIRDFFGSRPSDHYFRSVCWFVCLFVCLFVQSFSQPSLIRFRSN